MSNNNNINQYQNNDQSSTNPVTIQKNENIQLRPKIGDNPLDKTSIHTESYDVTLKLLNELNLSVNDIGTNKIKEV